MRSGAFAAVAAVIACAVALGGCGKPDGGAPSQQAQREEWLDWHDSPTDGGLFAGAGGTVFMYGQDGQKIYALSTDGKDLWQAPVQLPGSDAWAFGPPAVIREHDIVIQDPTTALITARDLATGKELWKFSPGTLGNCPATNYRMLAGHYLKDDMFVLAATGGESDEAEPCDEKAPIAAAVRMPASTEGGEQAGKPELAWKGGTKFVTETVDMPTIDPTGTYLSLRISDDTGGAVLERFEIKNGTEKTAAFPVALDENGEATESSSLASIQALSPSDYAVQDADSTDGAYLRVPAWHDPKERGYSDEIKREPAGPAGACLTQTGQVPGVDGKPVNYCFSATEEQVTFGALGVLGSDGGKPDVHTEKVNPHLGEGLLDFAITGNYPVGVTKDSTLFALVPAPGNVIKAVNAKTGEQLWSAKASEAGKEPAMNANFVPGTDTVVFSQGNMVVAVSATTGEQQWEEKLAKGQQIGMLTTAPKAVAIKIDSGKDSSTRYRTFGAKS